MKCGDKNQTTDKSLGKKWKKRTLDASFCSNICNSKM